MLAPTNLTALPIEIILEIVAYLGIVTTPMPDELTASRPNGSNPGPSLAASDFDALPLALTCTAFHDLLRRALLDLQMDKLVEASRSGSVAVSQACLQYPWSLPGLPPPRSVPDWKRWMPKRYAVVENGEMGPDAVTFSKKELYAVLQDPNAQQDSLGIPEDYALFLTITSAREDIIGWWFFVHLLESRPTLLKGLRYFSVKFVEGSSSFGPASAVVWRGAFEKMLGVVLRLGGMEMDVSGWERNELTWSGTLDYSPTGSSSKRRTKLLGALTRWWTKLLIMDLRKEQLMSREERRMGHPRPHTTSPVTLNCRLPFITIQGAVIHRCLGPRFYDLVYHSASSLTRLVLHEGACIGAGSGWEETLLKCRFTHLLTLRATYSASLRPQAIAQILFSAPRLTVAWITAPPADYNFEPIDLSKGMNPVVAVGDLTATSEFMAFLVEYHPTFTMMEKLTITHRAGHWRGEMDPRWLLLTDSLRGSARQPFLHHIALEIEGDVGLQNWLSGAFRHFDNSAGGEGEVARNAAQLKPTLASLHQVKSLSLSLEHQCHYFENGVLTLFEAPVDPDVVVAFLAAFPALEEVTLAGVFSARLHSTQHAPWDESVGVRAAYKERARDFWSAIGWSWTVCRKLKKLEITEIRRYEGLEPVLWLRGEDGPRGGNRVDCYTFHGQVNGEARWGRALLACSSQAI